jgi:hypothetical protein
MRSVRSYICSSLVFGKVDTCSHKETPASKNLATAFPTNKCRKIVSTDRVAGTLPVADTLLRTDTLRYFCKTVQDPHMTVNSKGMTFL